MTTFGEFTTVVSLAVKDRSSGKRMRKIMKVLRETKLLRDPSPERAVEACEKLGPTFVKIGQIASNRSDILPKEYCEALSKLRANVPAMEFDTVLECIDTSYGHPWQDVFSEINPKPLGSASIAQVHQAKLHDGTTVAVKVRRPGIVDMMHADILLMRKVIAVAEFMTPANQLFKTATGLIDELERTTFDELDFTVELKNLEHFYLDMERQAGITSPLPFPQHSTPEVLVMEYVEGISISNRGKASELGYNLAALGAQLTESYVTQVIDNGFFHADPHPGNIQIRNGEIVWIDLGMTGTLNAGERSAVSRMFLAIAANNVYDLKEALLCVARPGNNVRHGKLVEDLEMLLAQYGGSSVEEINVGQAFVDITMVLHKHSIAIPTAFTMLGRGFLTLEGVIEEIAPQVNLVKVLSDHVEMQMLDFESAKEKAKSMLTASLASAEAAARLPKQASSAIDMLQKGQLGVGLDMTVSNKLLGNIYTMVGRLSIALIAAALFMGSAIITTSTNAGPEVADLPVVCYFGFLGSFVLSVYVVFTTIKTRHQIRNDLDIS